MNIARVFIAFGIALLLSSLLYNTLGMFYRPPVQGLSSCVQEYQNDVCSDFVLQGCGDETDPSFSACKVEMYASQQFRDCKATSDLTYRNCIEIEQGKIKSHKIIYYVLLTVLGLITMIGGFALRSRESVATGFIGAGLIIILSPSFILTYSFLASMTFMNAPELLRTTSPELIGLISVEQDASQKILSYTNIVSLLVVLIVLIVFAALEFDRFGARFRSGFNVNLGEKIKKAPENSL